MVDSCVWLSEASVSVQWDNRTVLSTWRLIEYSVVRTVQVSAGLVIAALLNAHSGVE